MKCGPCTYPKTGSATDRAQRTLKENNISARQELERAIDLSEEFLTSEDLFAIPDQMSRRKWNGPWWHMAALCEMGETQRIPRSAANRAMDLLKNGAWSRFVINDSDAPQSNADREKMDCCHCELGVFY